MYLLSYCISCIIFASNSEFLHTPQEIWYNEENNQYTICNDNFEREDDLCSDSCSPLHCTSTSDHLNYLGIPMGSTDGVC